MNIPAGMSLTISWGIVWLGYLFAFYLVLRALDLVITAILKRFGLFRDVIQFMLWKRGADGYGPPPRKTKKKPQEDEIG